jgi:hypothetical protein
MRTLSYRPSSAKVPGKSYLDAEGTERIREPDFTVCVPDLTGTAPQITWADDLRATFVAHAIKRLADQGKLRDDETALENTRKLEAMLEEPERCTAAYWIDKYKDAYPSGMPKATYGL